MLVVDKQERRRQIKSTRNTAFVLLALNAIAIGLGGEVPMLVGLAVDVVAWFIYTLYLTVDLYETRDLDYSLEVRVVHDKDRSD